MAVRQILSTSSSSPNMVKDFVERFPYQRPMPTTSSILEPDPGRDLSMSKIATPLTSEFHRSSRERALDEAIAFRARDLELNRSAEEERAYRQWLATSERFRQLLFVELLKKKSVRARTMQHRYEAYWSDWDKFKEALGNSEIRRNFEVQNKTHDLLTFVAAEKFIELLAAQANTFMLFDQQKHALQLYRNIDEAAKHVPEVRKISSVK